MAKDSVPPELIVEMRDHILECYLRRLPEAAPEPGTSLYAIIEGSALIFASIVYHSASSSEILEGLRRLVAEDREQLVDAPPNPDEDFYKPLKDRETGETLRTHAHLPAPGTAPGTGCIL